MAVAKSDAEEKDRKEPETADSGIPESLKRADDDEDSDLGDADGPDDDDDIDSDDEDEEDDDGDDGSPIGEFRVRVMPNGNVRLVLDDDDDDGADDSDDDVDKADDDATDPEKQNDVDLARSEDAAEAKSDDKDDDDKKKDKDDSMDKSQQSADAKGIAVSEESLSKALKAVMQLANSQDPDARKKSLLAKAQSEDGLSKSEAKELFAGLGKKAKADTTLSERVIKSLTQNESLQKSQAEAAQDHDVAAFLEHQTDALAKSMGIVTDAIEASDQRHHAMGLVMSKAIGQIGAAVKLIGERLHVIESQPTRQPKSLSLRPMEKSFAGTPAEAPVDGHSLIDTLTRMNIDSMREGRNGLSKGHRPLMNGIEKAMSGLPVDPELMKEVHAYRQQQTA